MSFTDKLQKRLSELKDVITDRTQVPESIQLQRLSICEACPHLNKALYTCKQCGCFMKLKTRLAAAECPLEDKKWGKYEYKQG